MMVQRKNMILFVVIVMLLTGCTGDGYRQGTINGRNWENDWLGLGYQIPEDMELVEPGTLELESGMMETSYELVDSSDTEAVIVKTEAKGKLTDKEYLKITAEQLEEQSEGGCEAANIEEYEVAGLEFHGMVIELTQDGSGDKIYQRYLTLVKDDRRVDILLSALGQEELEILTEHFYSL